MVLRDVAIGGCKIPLGKVCGSGSDELCVPVVTKKGKHRGDAYISLTFKAGTTKVGAHRLGVNFRGQYLLGLEVTLSRLAQHSSPSTLLLKPSTPLSIPSRAAG